MTTMKRVLADFNSLDSTPVDLVKLATPGSWQEAQLPPLQQGERVILSLFCHVRHAVCRLSPQKEALAMTNTRSATPTVAFIDQYCGQ